MRILGTKLLIPLAAVIFVVLYWFRPGSVDGPRPEPVSPAGKSFSHQAFQKVLTAVVSKSGEVDYGALKANPADLDRYLGMIRAVSPLNAPHRFRSNNARLAYYLNAYNAFVLAGVRDLCPVTNIQDAYIGNGFFWRVSFLMGGEPITLSTLESERIRGVMQRNPIVHFALVKGARGFFPLSKEPFFPDRLDAQLDALARRVVATDGMVERSGVTLTLSALFEWYQHDFGDVTAWLKRFTPEKAKGEVKVVYRPFDWSLNGTCTGS